MPDDSNLHFGVLALQAGLINARQFAEICTLWAERKNTSLADLLIEKGWLQPGERNQINSILLPGSGVPSARAAFRSRAPPASSMPRAPATAAVAPPMASERYDLRQVHAVGGMGRVWIARDTYLNREVALKELRPEVASEAAIRTRFLREAQITGQLEHPGIVPVYELSRHPDSDQPFYTMRLVRGRTLVAASRAFHEKRKAGGDASMELLALLGAFVAVCNTIGYAHSHGVIHRDLKGDNIIVGDFGEVIVLDWGLAKPIDAHEEGRGSAPLHIDPLADAEQTIQGDVIGTPGYMAPEQAEGRLDKIDQRTDIYGLGAIFYEILTGQPPFAAGRTLEIIKQVLKDDPVPPRHLWAEVPPALEKACLQALAKERRDRFQSASELAQVVQTWQDVQRRQAEEALRKQTEILQSILDNMSESVLVADPQGKVLLMNPAAERMIGARPSHGQIQEVVPQHALFLPDRETPYPMEQLPMARAVRGEKVDDAEIFVRPPGNDDGLWLSANARPLRDSTGKLQGGLVVLRDITERKQSEEDLRRSQERFELAVRGSQDGLWDWDLETGDVYFSPRWKSIIGYEDHEIANRIEEWEVRLHPEEREQVIAVNQAHIDGTTPHYEHEYRLRHKDGSYRWILARGAALRRGDGKAYRMAGSHVDVTARKLTELEAKEK